MSARRQTALVVPVPEADAAVAGWRARLTPSGAAGMPAHITILHPFLEPGEVSRELPSLEDLVGGTPSFAFALRALRRFGQSVLYLEPDPAEPFAALTERVRERYPDRLPYEGAHEGVVPHLTVASTDDAAAAAEAERAVAASLPLACVAVEASLFQLVEGVWTVRARLPLGA